MTLLFFRVGCVSAIESAKSATAACSVPGCAPPFAVNSAAGSDLAAGFILARLIRTRLPARTDWRVSGAG